MDKVQQFRVVGVSEHSVRLSWVPVFRADRYKVEISYREDGNASRCACSSDVNASWSPWQPYQFPLGDYPGKGGGQGEKLADALFGYFPRVRNVSGVDEVRELLRLPSPETCAALVIH